jgi:hypothetical protein
MITIAEDGVELIVEFVCRKQAWTFLLSYCVGQDAPKPEWKTSLFSKAYFSSAQIAPSNRPSDSPSKYISTWHPRTFSSLDNV